MLVADRPYLVVNRKCHKICVIIFAVAASYYVISRLSIKYMKSRVG